MILDLFDCDFFDRFNGGIFAKKRLKPSSAEHRRKNCFVLLNKKFRVIIIDNNVWLSSFTSKLGYGHVYDKIKQVIQFLIHYLVPDDEHCHIDIYDCNNAMKNSFSWF